MVGTVEGTSIRSYGYSVLNSGVVGRGYSNGCIQYLSTFQSICSAKIRVKLSEGDKTGAQASEFIPEQFPEK
jgi:hypothetical protein